MTLAEQLEALNDVLEEFENCGQSEARAIAECIKDGTHDCSKDERLSHAESMAAECVDISKAIHERIKALMPTTTPEAPATTG